MRRGLRAFCDIVNRSRRLWRLRAIRTRWVWGRWKVAVVRYRSMRNRMRKHFQVMKLKYILQVFLRFSGAVESALVRWTWWRWRTSCRAIESLGVQLLSSYRIRAMRMTLSGWCIATRAVKHFNGTALATGWRTLRYKLMWPISTKSKFALGYNNKLSQKPFLYGHGRVDYRLLARLVPLSRCFSGLLKKMRRRQQIVSRMAHLSPSRLQTLLLTRPHSVTALAHRTRLLKELRKVLQILGGLKRLPNSNKLTYNNSAKHVAIGLGRLRSVWNRFAEVLERRIWNRVRANRHKLGQWMNRWRRRCREARTHSDVCMIAHKYGWRKLASRTLKIWRSRSLSNLRQRSLVSTSDSHSRMKAMYFAFLNMLVIT